MGDLEGIHSALLDAYKAVLTLGGVDLDALAKTEMKLPTRHVPIRRRLHALSSPNEAEKTRFIVLRLHAGVAQLNHRAVVAQGISGAASGLGMTRLPMQVV